MKKQNYPYVPDFLVRYKMRNDEKISKIDSPVLIIHSPDDEVIVYENGQKLFEQANEPKKFLEISGGHNDGMFYANEKNFEEIIEFLNTAI
ncbi:hypothetical protein C0583_06400 [Candidatus Parcubacteria bacterium]|nr:MAG: hypothetical protein C0583_06400 [Candidatus Parcubacteria bacterium]